MLLVAEHRCIRSHLHHIAVALDTAQMQSLCQCAVDIAVSASGGIFAEIDLRSLAVVVVIVVLIVDKPSHALVVVLVHEVDDVLMFECEEPTLDIVGRRSVERSCRAAYLYLGIFLAYGSAYHRESILKCRRDDVLVADADVFEIEWRGMSCLGSHLRPLACGRIAVGPLYHVENLLYISRHFVHRYSALLSAISVGVGSGVLTRHTGSEHGQRFGTDVLAELEVFVESQSARLMIIPYIAVGRAILKRSDGVFPPIYIIQSVAVAHAASGESHKLRLQVGNRLCEIGTQSVLPSLESLLWEQADHVHERGFLALSHKHQFSGRGGFRRCERC